MREYLVNADFDLGLRPGRRPDAADGRGRMAAEMPSHLLLLGLGDDSVLVSEPPDRRFLEAMERAGLGRPRCSVLPEIRRQAEFSPFGWSDEAAAINSSYERPSAYPSLDVVRRVNGRRFAAEVERELFAVEEVRGVFEKVEDVERVVGGLPRDEEWLLKSEHGNAALGNRRLRPPAGDRADLEVVGRLLDEDVCVLVERWRERVLDIASVFEVMAEGPVADLEIYEVVNTADGAFLGSIFDPDSETLDPWREEVAEIALAVGERLAREGYFGPVCLDHFVWTDGGTHRLRPLADLNARLQVSAPFLRLWRSWNRDRVVSWRLHGTRKLALPAEVERLDEALGDDAWNPEERLGVLVTSPPVAAGHRLRRVGVLLAGFSRDEVDRLERRLGELFGR